MKLRYYQQDVIDEVKACWRNGIKKILIQLPCGAGKTVVFAFMADQSQKNKKIVWFLVHRQELLNQTIDTFKKFNIPLETITIAMIGAVANHLERYPKPDLIIFDEAHFSMARTWTKITDAYPDVYICGLTATPCRLDGKPLGKIYDKLIEGITANELIEKGYLSKYKYYAPAVANFDSFDKKGSDFNLDKASQILSKRAIFGDVIKHYKKHANGLQTICYCTSIKHSQAMAEAFNEAGIKAVHFDGNTPKSKRTKIIEDFRNKKITVLCNVDLISVGFDCPDCWCCILLRPTMSTALYIQQACRALRPTPNKTAIILDCVNNYTRFSLPTDDRKWSLDSTIKQHNPYEKDGTLKVRTCTECFATFNGKLDKCPYCNTPREMTIRELQNIKNIQLQEIQQAKLQKEKAKKQALDKQITDKVKNKKITECNSLKEMQCWCKANGKKSGYAYIIAKKKGLVR